MDQMNARANLKDCVERFLPKSLQEEVKKTALGGIILDFWLPVLVQHSAYIDMLEKRIVDLEKRENVFTLKVKVDKEPS